MLQLDLGAFLYSVVSGLHNGKNSEQAAGLKSEDYLQLGRPTKALAFSFDIRCDYYAPTGSKYQSASSSCSLHYLFHRTYGSTGFCSTYTFASVHKDCFANLNEVKDWEFLSSHDSCWKDAAKDYARNLEGKLFEEVHEKAGFFEPTTYDTFNWSVDFPIFNRQSTVFYSWVDVQIDRDETDPHHYEKKIKLL